MSDGLSLDGGGSAMVMAGLLWTPLLWATYDPHTALTGLLFATMGFVFVGFAPGDDDE